MDGKKSKEASNKVSKDELEERQHFRKVLRAFKSYKEDQKTRLNRSRGCLAKLPFAHRELLTCYSGNLDEAERCIEANHELLLDVIKDVANMFENVNQPEDIAAESNGTLLSSSPAPRTAPMDREKIQSTLKQFVRDWSSDGEEERSKCYGPILDEIQRLFKSEEGTGNDGNTSKEDRKVLVPGAGLGRLAFDIARLGYECQGNEFSLYMLFAANFVLNKCAKINCFKIFPWIHQTTSNFSVEDNVRPAFFPDIDPNELPEGTKFSMVAGDFLDVYSDAEYANSQDCVVTCFFLDCAHNIIDFVQLIHKIVKPGGHWINLGPLLYHFADMAAESSIEPSYDVVKKAIVAVGFEFQKEETDIEMTYCANPKSMLQYRYKSVFFTCKK